MQDRTIILSEIKKAIREVDSSAEVTLFGSHARGDENKESDWDVLIISPDNKATWVYKQRLVREILATELQLGVTISAVIRNRDDWQASAQTWFYQEVAKDGKVLV